VNELQSEQTARGRIDHDGNNGRSNQSMKKILSAALMLGLATAPLSAAFAQSASQTETPSPGQYAPDSANAPIHGSHDKGAGVREDNDNGIATGRSSSDGSMSSPDNDAGGATLQGTGK
jgi:hypothetical protein